MRSSGSGRTSCHPALELLEARECPAFSIFYTGSVLLISGRPTLPFAAAGDGLQLHLQPSGLVQVTEVGNAGATVVNRGAFRPPANILILLDFTNRDVTIDMGGGRLPSNILLNLGKGDFSPPPAALLGNPVNIINGEIGGNLTILGGSGSEFINLGQSGGAAGGALPVIIDGDTTVVLSSNRSLIGDALDINFMSELRGRLSATEVDNINVGEIGFPTAFVRKDLVSNVARSRNVGKVDVFGEVDGNVQFTGSPAIDPIFADSVIVETTGTVFGNVTAALGIGLGDTAIHGTVRGNLTLTGALGNDFVSLDGIVLGSVTMDLRTGDNTVFFIGSVGGSLSITAGNGNNDLGSGTPGILAGTVGGNLIINLGNGNNTVDVLTAPGGMLIYTSGNGSDSLSLGADVFNVLITFGTGTDILTLDPGTTLSGTVIGQGGNNTFNQNGATLLPMLSLINFP